MCSRTMLNFLLSLRTGMLRIAVRAELCFLLKACHVRHAQQHNASRLGRETARIGLLVPLGLHCNVSLLSVFQTVILMSHGRQSARGEWFFLRFPFCMTTGLFFMSGTLTLWESWLLCGKGRRLFAHQVMRFILLGLIVYICATGANMWCHRPPVRTLFRPATCMSMVEWTRHFCSVIENFISLIQMCAILFALCIPTLPLGC